MTAGRVVVNAAMDGLRRRPGLQVGLAIALGLGTLGGLGAYAAVSGAGAARVATPFGNAPAVVLARAALAVAVVSALALGGVIVSWTPYRAVDADGQRITALQLERQQLKHRLQRDELANVYATVQLGLNQLEEYYVLNLRQAKVSFRVAVGTTLLAFATIVTGISVFFLQESNVVLTGLTTVAGVLMEFVSVTAFRLHKRSSEQVKRFYDELLRTQDTMLAIKVADDVQDPVRRRDLRTHIALTLIDRGHGRTPEDPAPGFLKDTFRRLRVQDASAADPPAQAVSRGP